MKKLTASLLGFVLSLIFITPVSAHEVYILSNDEIAKYFNNDSLNIFSVFSNRYYLIMVALGAFISLLILLIGYYISLWDISVRFNNYLKKLFPLASLLLRLILSFALVTSIMNNSLFGPEISLSSIHLDNNVKYVFIALAILLDVGFFVRYIAILLTLLFTYFTYQYNIYFLTYIEYLGVFLVLLMLGGEKYSLDAMLFRNANTMDEFLTSFGNKYAIPVLRITLGIALVFGAVWVKFLHPALSLRVIEDYDITSYIHLYPLFIIVGAGFIEILLGILFIIGYQLRLSVILFIGMMIVSLLFFKESLWPHAILFGIGVAIFIYGYDRYSLQRFLTRKSKNIDIADNQTLVI